jgi:uncharacterized membrane protein
MNTKLITAIIVIVTILGLIAWDIWVVIEPTPGDTVSEIFLGFAYSHPFSSFALGVLCGHLTWPRTFNSNYKWTILAALIINSVAILVLDLSGILPRMLPIIPLAVGIPIGHLLWPQPKSRAK